jgi:protein-tyrosine phosphatase
VALLARSQPSDDHAPALVGTSNFRDVGGLRTATGAMVRPHRVYRSGVLDAQNGRARRALAGLGLRTIVDLRSDDETACHESYVPRRATRYHLPLGDPVDLAAFDGRGDPADVADRYLDLCLAASPSIAATFAVLAEPSAYPVLVHGALGRDRTGVLVALLLRAIGVPALRIVGEYTRSANTDPEAMLRFLGRIDDEFGSLTGYLRRLGIVGTIPFLGAALLA